MGHFLIRKVAISLKTDAHIEKQLGRIGLPLEKTTWGFQCLRRSAARPAEATNSPLVQQAKDRKYSG
jgi:hypothetical protein